MKFDVYYAMKTRAGLIRPGVKPHPLEWSNIKTMMEAKANTDLIRRFREGDADAKAQLPAVCFVGECMKTRANKWMKPTQAVMIDIDHVEDPKAAYEQIFSDLCSTDNGRQWFYENCLLWAITPSGHGLRGVVWAQKGIGESKIGAENTLPRQMEYLNEALCLSKYGDFDAPCKDFARISFFFDPEEILFENAQLLTEFTKRPDGVVVNYGLERKELSVFDSEAADDEENPAKPSAANKVRPDDVPVFSEEELAEIRCYDYDGTPLVKIIDKFVEVNGQPGRMKVHNYYNNMVKNFRNIMNNDARIVFALLPRFGHSDEECWSQCQSICRSNTLSKLPKEFFFFLKDNGWYKGNKSIGSVAEYMLKEDTNDVKEKMPWTPPVFRELLDTAPYDFKYPLLVGLLPILGTLTSYVGARYYYGKNEYHTTSFFSVIYAPAGTGKGFISDFMDLLFAKIKQRDYIQSARDQIFLNEVNRKSGNDKGPDDPNTSLRIIYPKNSEAEFLAKQKNNHGYHMFTFAAEMDSWAKGVKAAGGNKDDMLRIAWDNGDYGQNFKSSNTVKGGTKLYWNVLITGTLPQVQSYFKNVENGLVTRTSFCSIDNQEFADAPHWKDLTEAKKAIVNRFVERCDARSYKEPCTLFPEDIDAIAPSKFDEEVDWHFNFRSRQTIDMGWLRPTIEDWLKEQQKMAVKDYDKARDVFRRRCAVRGFRLGLMCTQMWESPRPSDLRKCCPFIRWFMDKDMEQMMKLWGKAYNEVAQDQPNLAQKSIYNALGDSFEKNDILIQLQKAGIVTPVAQVIYKWKKFGFIEKKNKMYFKTKKKDGRNIDEMSYQ